MTTRETETTWLAWRDTKTGDIINVYAEETGGDGGAAYDSRTTINGNPVRSRDQEAGVLRRRILELASGATVAQATPTTDRGLLHDAVSRIEDNVRELLHRVPPISSNPPHLEMTYSGDNAPQLWLEIPTSLRPSTPARCLLMTAAPMADELFEQYAAEFAKSLCLDITDLRTTVVSSDVNFSR